MVRMVYKFEGVEAQLLISELDFPNCFHLFCAASEDSQQRLVVVSRKFKFFFMFKNSYSKVFIRTVNISGPMCCGTD